MSAGTVFIVDDCREVLDSTAALLGNFGFQVEKFDDPRAFLEAFDSTRPGVILLDLRMQIAGLEVLTRLRRLGSELPVLFLAAHAEVDQVVQAMQGGARDFLLKPAPGEDLARRLAEAIDDDLKRRAATEQLERVLALVNTLSRREREVMDLTIFGRTSREIGDELGIVEKTVESHRGRVIRTFGVKNAVELTSTVLMAGYRPIGPDGSRVQGR